MADKTQVHELDEHDALLRPERDRKLADGIGTLFINFALFNAHLNSALTAQLKLSLEQARALILPLQPRPKLEMIQAYAKHHWEKSAADEVKHICQMGLALTDYRNDIAHGDLILRDPEGEVEIATYKGASRFSPKLRPLAPDEVAHNAMHTLHLAREFRSLAIAIAKGETFVARRPPPKEGQ